MVAVDPRSTWSHCGSLAALDHRVPVLPSTAALAGVPAFSTDDAVAGLPCDSRVAAARAVPTATTEPGQQDQDERAGQDQPARFSGTPKRHRDNRNHDSSPGRMEDGGESALRIEIRGAAATCQGCRLVTGERRWDSRSSTCRTGTAPTRALFESKVNWQTVACRPNWHTGDPSGRPRAVATPRRRGRQAEHQAGRCGDRRDQAGRHCRTTGRRTR